MLASAHQLSVTAYTASISEKENYYSLPCFYTPLEGNKISEIVPGMSNNGSGSWQSYNPDGARAIYYDGYIYIYGGISTTARPEAYGVSEARSRKLFKINISNYFN